MAPSRFKKEPREKREVTPFADEPSSMLTVVPPEIPEEWRDIEAPTNFTWVVQDELAGMGWPKSRDQVSFLIRQGIDHVITLAADKIPPHYAFPELKWTMIPVEDFTGPAIADIKKFIQIMAEARRDGEAVGVHCAEGRGRTGVICACYLIYYYDMEPWDAIRIMRRQRPGSVERKVQEETVVMFYDLLNDDFGCLDNIESKEKEYKRLKQQEKLQKDNMICAYTALLHGPVNRVKNRDERQERMRRARSLPKINGDMDESIKEEVRLRQHFEDFFQDTGKRRTSRERSRPPLERPQNPDELEGQNRFDRGTTPGRALIQNLKPAPRKSEVEMLNRENKCDLKNHFKEFMSTTNTMKRARSFSQPRDKKKEEEAENESEKDTNSLEKVSLRPSRSHVRGEAKPPSESSGSERASTASTEEYEEEILSSVDGKPPQPPKYRPSLDSSSTSSYYARVRTRASVVASKKMEDNVPSSAPSSATVSRKFDPNARKFRSKTIEIGFLPEAKMQPQEEAVEEADSSLDQEVETILSDGPLISNNVNAKSKTPTSPRPLTASAKVRPPSTSTDTLKVTQEQEVSKSRLSPFNRFRTSLVNPGGGRKNSTEATGGLSGLGNSLGARQRTESETKPESRKSRFFYRKSRTGPLDGLEAATTSASSSNSNSTSTLEQEEVHNRPSIRAKSEFNPRTSDYSSTTASTLASSSTSNPSSTKDNLFMAAARKWASYDKPSYQTPFTRDNWKRSHRKFNYSRFLSYTRETFV